MGKQNPFEFNNRKFPTITAACKHFEVPISTFYFKARQGLSFEDIFIHTNGTARNIWREPVTPNHNLEVLYPNLMKEWDHQKNVTLDPAKLSPNSGKSVWWICENDASHEWQTSINNRAHGSRCPYCTGKITTPENSLSANFPKIAEQYAEDLNPRPLSEISVKCGQVVRWRCSDNPEHIFVARPADRVEDSSGCPICSGRQAWSGNNALLNHPHLQSELDESVHPDINLEEHIPTSLTVYQWKCQKEPTHGWKTSLYNRTQLGHSCTVCQSLGYLHPELLKEWHPTKNSHLDPFDLMPGSSQTVCWKCPKGEDHEWEIDPGKRTGSEKTGCPFCAGQRLSITNRLDTVRPDVASRIIFDQGLIPEKLDYDETTVEQTYFTSAKRKFWFYCLENKEHVFETTPNYFTVREGSCPICRKPISKLQLEVETHIDELGYGFVREKTYDDLKSINGRALRFDLYLPDLDCLIEVDGEQHDVVMRFRSKEEEQARLDGRRDRDARKNRYCAQKKIKFLRIKYGDKHIKRKLTEFLRSELVPAGMAT